MTVAARRTPGIGGDLQAATLRSVSLAHAALPFASLLFVVLLGGCRSLGGAGEPNQPAADGTVAEGADRPGHGPIDDGWSSDARRGAASTTACVSSSRRTMPRRSSPCRSGSPRGQRTIPPRSPAPRTSTSTSSFFAGPAVARRGKREIEAVGGTVAAWTGLDETVYQATLAAPSLDVGLDVLADALTARPSMRPSRPRRTRSGRIARDAIDPGHVRRAVAARSSRRRARPSAARPWRRSREKRWWPFRRDLLGRQHDRRRGGRRRRAPRARGRGARIRRPFHGDIRPRTRSRPPVPFPGAAGFCRRRRGSRLR